MLKKILAGVALFGILFCAAELAFERPGKTDETTEKTLCQVEYTQPPVVICQTEEQVCQIQGGLVSCKWITDSETPGPYLGE